MELKKLYEAHKWLWRVTGALVCVGIGSYCYDGSVFPRLSYTGSVLTALALWFVRGEIHEQIEREKRDRGVDVLSKFLTTIEKIDPPYRSPVTQNFSPEEAEAILKGESLKINDEEKRKAFFHLLGNNDQKDGDNFTLDENNVLRLRSAIGDVLNRLNWMGMIEEGYKGIEIMKRDMIDFLSPKPGKL